MRRSSVVIGLCFMLALVLNVLAAQRGHPDVMQDVRGTVGSLNTNLEEGNGSGIAADASKMEGLFKELLPIYEQMGYGPVEQATAAAAAAAATAEAAGANNIDAAREAAGGVTGACRGCHMQFREKVRPISISSAFAPS